MLGSGNNKITAALHSDIPELEAQALGAIRATLKSTGGNIQAAAKKLKIGRTTLNRWIYKYPELRAVVIESRRANE